MTAFLQGNTVVVGLQWGDEGKGKIVDFLTEHADVVVRYCGGANAGHSVKIGGEKYATHLLPVGVFRPNVLNIIGNGVVLDPEVLLSEIDDLSAVDPIVDDVARVYASLPGVMGPRAAARRFADLGCSYEERDPGWPDPYEWHKVKY